MFLLLLGGVQQMLFKFSTRSSHCMNTHENPWPTFYLEHETEGNLCKKKHLVSEGKFANSCKKQFVSQMLWRRQAEHTVHV